MRKTTKAFSGPIFQQREYYAMKVMIVPTQSNSTSSSSPTLSKIENEINILRSLDHVNVLKYVDQFYVKAGRLKMFALLLLT